MQYRIKVEWENEAGNSGVAELGQVRIDLRCSQGCIEQERAHGEAFAIVRDLDKRAKPKVQTVLRRAGRTAETAMTVLSDGEDGLRGVVGCSAGNASIVWTGSMSRAYWSGSVSNCYTCPVLRSMAFEGAFIQRT
jgi:hypothetical protein